MKKTISYKLAHRDYKTPSKFQAGFYNFLTSILHKKYNCEYTVIDDINKEEGPAFVIFNHLSRFDHLFINQLMKGKAYNTVVARNEFYRGAQYYLFAFGKIIPKRNFTLDKTAMQAIRKVIESGGTVCFAPEGMTPMDGQNHAIVPGTGKMFKHYNVPVYQVELRGQFMIASKVCLDERLGGKCTASIKKLYTPEDLQRMTPEEIDADLTMRFKHDEFEWQKEHHYKYDLKGESCKNLEDLCFMCPKCRKYFTMKSEGDHIFCTECGNGTYMDDYYDFKPFEGSEVPETPSKWCDMERMDIIKAIRADENYSFSIKVKLGKLPEDKLAKGNETSVICGEGTLTINHDGVKYVGTKDGEQIELFKNYEKLFTMLSALDFKFFDLYFGTDWYDFFPIAGEEGKIGYIQLLIEEMHKLHSDYVKPLPWTEYMYE